MLHSSTMSGRAKRNAGIALLVAALLLAFFAVRVFQRASRALDLAGRETAAAGNIRVTAARLDTSVSTPFEPVGSPSQFTDATLFGSSLYVCGPSGLSVYDLDGKLLRQYAVGRELPPAPLVALATGTASGSAEPELFIATAGEGLLAFNGREFRHIRAQQAAYRHLTAVLPLLTGRVLLGTQEKGVLAWDGKRLAQFHPSLSDVHVTALAGSESNLWAGTLDGGALHWHAGQTDKPEGLPDPQVLSLAGDGDTVWAGTPLGVAEFRDGRFARVLASGFFARKLFHAGNRLFVGTLDEGVVELPLGAQPARAPRPRPVVLPGAVQRLLQIDTRVFALSDSGLYRLGQRGGAWERVLGRDPSAGGLADRNIAALAADRAGRLWIGYFDRGLDIVEAGAATGTSRVTHVEDEHVFCVNRIAHDEERGLTAVATANGLVLFDAAGRQRQVLGREQGLIANHVTDVVLGGGGSMVVATPAGITFLDAGGARSLYAFHGLVNNHVYALGASGTRVLAGTLGGISVLEGGVVEAGYTTANSALKHNWITALVPVGDEWFAGTYGAGVMRMDAAGRWHSFADAAGSEVNPNAMIVAGDRVLAGTLGQGLYIYERTQGRWRSLTAGLPSANVTALAAHNGSVYVGTDNGLVRISEQDLALR